MSHSHCGDECPLPPRLSPDPGRGLVTCNHLAVAHGLMDLLARMQQTAPRRVRACWRWRLRDGAEQGHRPPSAVGTGVLPLLRFCGGAFAKRAGLCSSTPPMTRWSTSIRMATMPGGGRQAVGLGCLDPLRSASLFAPCRGDSRTSLHACVVVTRQCSCLLLIDQSSALDKLDP